MSGRYITETEMRRLLREAYVRDPENSFLGQIGRSASDPIVPRDANNRPRIHPLWLTLGLVAMFVIGVLFYFSLVK